MAAAHRRGVGLAMLATLGLLGGWVPGSGATPGAGRAAGELAGLTEGVSELGRSVGISLDPAPALVAARLSPVFTARLEATVRQLLICRDATARLLAGLPAEPGRLLGDGVTLTRPPAGTDAIRTCAEDLKTSGLDLQALLVAEAAGGGADVDLWPALRLDLDGTDDTIAHDYMLSVDSGGNDLYLNNAGGNLIDVQRGPAQGPARGCINPAYDLLAGECVISEALLVDAAGDDTYGRMEPPDPELDGLCTPDPLVHRVMTGGVGSWGVGILLEGRGNDTYLGKSITLGAGHFGGVGMLVDESGDDRYDAIRLAKGFGTLFGLGVFRDVSGNDTYSYYLPRPRYPNAVDRTLGAGGALDTGGTCDKVSRWEEGSGFLGGVGVFFDDAGDDVYQVAPPNPHEPGASEIIRQTGSLGFGDGGFGIFVDRAGRDTYTGMPDRADGATVGPSGSSQGFFHDEGNAGAHSSAAAGPRNAAGPGGGGGGVTAWFTHYIPETVSIPQGGTLQFFNPDLYGGPFGGRAHTLTEDRPKGPPRFDVEVGWGNAAPVQGVDQLSPGRYDFTCRIHPFMHGTLVVN